MIFTETNLRGAFIIEVEKLEDNRGFFSRAWCQKESDAYRLGVHFVQFNITFSKTRGTLRGLHYQTVPYEEVKLIRCTKGGIYDVAIDLRPASATFSQWIGVKLTANNHKMLYVPEGFAHGYETLEDNSEVFYATSECYFPEGEGGVRYNDPAFGISWPTDVLVISDKDKSWPDYVL